MQKITRLTLFFVMLFLAAGSVGQTNKVIRPGELWPDNNGEHVQAHGGGIIKIKDTYYWYGEERRKGLDTNFRYVSCYASKDLVNWTFKGDVVKMTDPENLGYRWVLESKLSRMVGSSSFISRELLRSKPPF